MKCGLSWKLNKTKRHTHKHKYNKASLSSLRLLQRFEIHRKKEQENLITNQTSIKTLASTLPSSSSSTSKEPCPVCNTNPTDFLLERINRVRRIKTWLDYYFLFFLLAFILSMKKLLPDIYNNSIGLSLSYKACCFDKK